ncbi:hypothetical protein [Isobaculum melis]|uniref:Uncharacterized protein n=1 Tax=Isobaculum melis TaxID=142588 RepID=A0A1H9TP29_9LACT|nr:hypothetical protein [Isobaculum melis]SER98865.1 hypothetical protein SAMN04488559_11531 [Isobaculum melis]
MEIENQTLELMKPVIKEMLTPVIEEAGFEMLKQTLEKLVEEKQRPLVITNKEIREMFSISTSTLWNLKQFADFPKEWLGIKNHYETKEVLKWFDENEGQVYQEKKELLKLVD